MTSTEFKMGAVIRKNFFLSAVSFLCVFDFYYTKVALAQGKKNTEVTEQVEKKKISEQVFQIVVIKENGVTVSIPKAAGLNLGDVLVLYDATGKVEARFRVSQVNRRRAVTLLIDNVDPALRKNWLNRSVVLIPPTEGSQSGFSESVFEQPLSHPFFRTSIGFRFEPATSLNVVSGFELGQEDLFATTRTEIFVPPVESAKWLNCFGVLVDYDLKLDSSIEYTQKGEEKIESLKRSGNHLRVGAALQFTSDFGVPFTLAFRQFFFDERNETFKYSSDGRVQKLTTSGLSSELELAMRPFASVWFGMQTNVPLNKKLDAKENNVQAGKPGVWKGVQAGPFLNIVHYFGPEPFALGIHIRFAATWQSEEVTAEWLVQSEKFSGVRLSGAFGLGLNL